MHAQRKLLLSALLLLLAAIGVVGLARIQNRTPEPVPTETESPIPDSWQSVDAGSFVISLPPSWQFNPRQGIDSYVGGFIGDGVTLGFDYGWYSNSLADESDSVHVVAYETIDGQRAKIVVPKIAGRGTTGVYVEGLGGNRLDRLQVSGDNLTASQQETALRIFRTIQFKEQNEPVEDVGNATEKADLIRLESPRPGQTVRSPLVLRGQARGTWFFEASFPVTIVDWDGRIIGQGIAQAQGEWMTTEFVPFEATLTFTADPQAYSTRGSLILQKDNPSGLPEYDDALEIPVVIDAGAR